MERVAVIGCGGAGKTTVARELGRILDLPVIHIDGYYRRPSHGEPGEAWTRVHRELVSRERWVFDGMKLGALAERLERADTVVFLDVPRWACFAGIAQRRLRLRGQARPEPGVGRVDLAFLRWVWTFRRTQRARILDLLASCECRVVVLRDRRQMRRFLSSLAPRGEGERVAVGRRSDWHTLQTKP